MKNLDDSILVEMIIKGSDEAIEIIINKYSKYVYNFILLYVKDKDEVSDLTQEVFVKVWRNLNKYNQDKSFKTWIFTIAKNTTLDFIKKKRAIPVSRLVKDDDNENILNTLKDPEPLPDELFEMRNLKEKLDSVLDDLPILYKRVLLMYYKDDLNLREISEVLGVSIETIKSQHRRALILLRGKLCDNLKSAPNI